jgi:RES domain-containing protein
MRAFRIADSRFPVFDGRGASIAGGRWNTPGQAVIYAAETFAGAMLEILVHTNLYRLPRNYSHIEVRIPETIRWERFTAFDVPDWNLQNQVAARRFGDQWLGEARSSVLVVPSIVTGGIETNLLLNPLHPEFGTIVASQPQPVKWDSRFFTAQKR